MELMHATPLRLPVHLLVGVAISLIAPFTGFAWPFALLVGMVLGKADAARMRGEPGSTGDDFVRALAIAGGILAMLFFGAIIGGIVAVVVVALAAFSERVTAFATPTDQGVARILLFVVPILAWIACIALGVNIDIRIGS